MLPESLSTWAGTQAWSKQLVRCRQCSPAGRARHGMTLPRPASVSRFLEFFTCVTLQGAVFFLCVAPLEDLDKRGGSHSLPDSSPHLPSLSVLSLQGNLAKREHTPPPFCKKCDTCGVHRTHPGSIVCLGEKVCMISFQHEGSRSGRQA